MAFVSNNRYLVIALTMLVSIGSLDIAGAHTHDDDDDTVYTASWEAKAGMPEKRSDMTASTVGSNIYVIGGCDQHQVKLRVHARLVTGPMHTHSIVYNCSHASHQVACDWWEGCSYCPSISDEVIVYTPSSDSFTTSSTNMPRARYRHAAAVVDTSIYVFGGRDINDDLISEVDILDTTDMTWSTPSTATWNIPRSDEGAFYYSETGLIYGEGHVCNVLILSLAHIRLAIIRTNAHQLPQIYSSRRWLQLHLRCLRVG